MHLPLSASNLQGSCVKHIGGTNVITTMVHKPGLLAGQAKRGSVVHDCRDLQDYHIHIMLITQRMNRRDQL